MDDSIADGRRCGGALNLITKKYQLFFYWFLLLFVGSNLWFDCMWNI